MKVLLSPAKSLDLKSALPTKEYSKAKFLDEAEKLNKELKKQSVKKLKALMKISDSLAQLNYTRNQEWALPFTAKNARPAIYMFNGDAFRGFDAYSLQENNIDDMQNSIRILSGMYGVLKPLDLIQPYRLEMKTKLGYGKFKKLYDLWTPKLAKQINSELKKDEVVLNLASNEYYKAINENDIDAPIYTATFKDFKNGTYKVIMTYAKQARGLMARYVVENGIDSVNDLKGFNVDGYRFSEELSSGKELVFTR